MSFAVPFAIDRTVPVTLSGAAPTALTTAAAEKFPCMTTAPSVACQPPTTLLVLVPGAAANTSIGDPALANVTSVHDVKLLVRNPFWPAELSDRKMVAGPSGWGAIARPCRLAIMLPVVVPLMLVHATGASSVVLSAPLSSVHATTDGATSPGCPNRTPSKHTLPAKPAFAGTNPPSHPELSNPSHVAAHARVPAGWPRVSQVAPPTSSPSHSSVPSFTPFPHVLHPRVSSLHSVLHASRPPSNPRHVQVAPPSAAPSHSSSGSTAPLPHRVHRLVSSVQLAVHPSVPAANPSSAHVCPPRSGPSHSSAPCAMRSPHTCARSWLSPQPIPSTTMKARRAR